LGSFGRHGDGSGDLAMPKGVAVDRDGVVYVVDGLFDNVQLFDRSGAFLLTLGAAGGRRRVLAALGGLHRGQWRAVRVRYLQPAHPGLQDRGAL
jgi:hypothetical protein